MIDILSQTTFHKNLVIRAFIGAELAGGGGVADSAPTLPMRIILDPIPGRGLMPVWCPPAHSTLSLLFGIPFDHLTLFWHTAADSLLKTGFPVDCLACY